MPETVADYLPVTAKFGGTTVARMPMNAENLKMGADLQLEELELMGHMDLSAVAVLKKRPLVNIQIPDPTFVQAWTVVGAGETYTSFAATYRTLAAGAGYGSAYVSYTFANGVLVPTQMRSEVGKGSEVDIDFHGLFSDAGVCAVKATTADTTPQRASLMKDDGRGPKYGWRCTLNLVIGGA